MLANIFPIDDLRILARSRSKTVQTKSVHPKLVEETEAEGWIVASTGKTSVRLQRQKPLSIAFEDRVWNMLFRMQFDYLSGSGGGKLALDLDNTDGPRNQLDVVAIDSELILGIECKTSEKYSKRPQFQEELAKLNSYRERLGKTISSQYPSSTKRPTILVFFGYNINLSENDKERAKQINVSLFDEKDLDYYEKLISHLGPAAKYQFLADMLPGKTIPGLSIKVPAVKTKMGGYNCYTFPISPEYLLKISYVSHRSKGKASDVHTYQRMVAKSRLKSIKKYISEDGIFPTNIVVNLDKKCIDFQRGKQENTQVDANTSGISGWLYLRPTYKSAWIIDGQHRLFAYSGHPRSKSGHLSVLAFEGIPSSTQARLFIDINREQKSVKQSLLQELYAELHWNSDNPSVRIQAIISKIVQVLGSEKDSPFYGRIQTADAGKDTTRCISLATVFKALEKSLFIVKEIKGEVLEWGPFWAIENNTTMRRAGTVIKQWFELIKGDAPEWWELGSAEGGGFAMNDSVAACINVLKSVLNHLEQSGRRLIHLTDAELVDAITPYGAVLGTYFSNFTPDERKRYRDLRGSQGQTARTRRCQQAIRKKFTTFDPPGLDDFLNSEKEQTNLRAKQILDRVEILLKKLVTEELKQEFSTDTNSWWQEGVPKTVRLEVTRRLEGDDNRRGSKEAYFDIIDYRTIATTNWAIFQKLLGYGEKKNESKDKQTKWLVEINEWRNQVAHPSSGVILHVDSLAQLEIYEKWLKSKLSVTGDEKDSSDSPQAESEEFYE